MKEEALDRTLWRTHFGRCYGPDARHTTQIMNMTKPQTNLYRLRSDKSWQSTYLHYFRNKKDNYNDTKKIQGGEDAYMCPIRIENLSREITDLKLPIFGSMIFSILNHNSTSCPHSQWPQGSERRSYECKKSTT